MADEEPLPEEPPPPAAPRLQPQTTSEPVVSAPEAGSALKVALVEVQPVDSPARGPRAKRERRQR